MNSSVATPSITVYGKLNRNDLNNEDSSKSSEDLYLNGSATGAVSVLKTESWNILGSTSGRRFLLCRMGLLKLTALAPPRR